MLGRGKFGPLEGPRLPNVAKSHGNRPEPETEQSNEGARSPTDMVEAANAGRTAPEVLAATRADALLRARSALRSGTYGLGKGGRRPKHRFPWDTGDSARLVDCSGFVSGCVGVDRYQPHGISGEWIETSAVYRDAIGEQRMFRRVKKPQAGDLIVYPDRNGGQGHIGIISRVDGGLPSLVIHCSKGNQRKHGTAIQETDARVFTNNGAIYVAFNRFDLEATKS
jgi:hypothetical protein